MAAYADFRRIALWFAAAVLTLVVLLVATLPMPVPSWRTGRLPVPPLEVVEGGPKVTMASRIWIDTDAACGASARADPDDCFAIALLFRVPGMKIAGLSTVFGNAALDVADRTARVLADLLERSGAPSVPIFAGSPLPLDQHVTTAAAPAHSALQQALTEGPLTIVALGPLTNVAAALDGRPDLQKHVSRIVAVMGRRPGHIFHPGEGGHPRMLLGHGPVFRDLNFVTDAPAAATVLAMHLPITLVPYDIGRHVTLTKADLERMTQDPALQWIVAQSQGWLEFWEKDIGQGGFHPFDLLAAAYTLNPGLFNCSDTQAWIAPDHTLFYAWFYSPDALLVGQRVWDTPTEAKTQARVIYCPLAAASLHSWLITHLHGSAAPP